ncbi:phosphoribosyltransferase [Pyrobaculum sp.]|uniref:Phosphoribosyltransferase n=1 Tax=Pyrobaculum oguniense (strain DSM 13380 / JCM 10595 / TE7) TaxID=698757 RepID=H6Q6Y2_PYROT|nr:putative phosphoribosyltransferase [Pyrobaculum oguniense TE7]
MPKIPVKVVTFEEIVEWSRTLAERIRESGWQPDVIVAIARGGYIPARLLCDWLGVSDLVSIQVVHWPTAAQMAEKAYVKYPVSVDLSGKKVLVVDDIVDTGDSVELAKKSVEECCKPAEVRTATLQVITPVAKYIPNYYAIEVKEWIWFAYPWNAVEDAVGFVMKIVKETGKTTWCLDELIHAHIEWYGREYIEKRFGYILYAVDLMGKRGLIKLDKCTS